jgi:hypothetical protein
MHVDAPASLPVGSPAPHRFRTAALALTALWAIVILAHLGVVSGLETFAYEDFLSWFAPTRMVVDAAWAGGRVPAWDPFVGVGGPLVFNSAAAPLYPLNALAAGPLGGGMTGLHRLIVLHLALGGTFTYLLLAERGCRPFVALAGGLSFAFAGPLLSYAQENPYHVFGLTWVPLGLMAFLRFLETGRRWPVALAGVCMALMLYGGEPQVWYFFVCLLTAAGLGHALGEATPPGRRTRALGRIALALTAVVVLALLLSAAQSAATLAGLRDSARGRGEPLDVRLAFSVHPLRYLSLLLPDFTGTPFPENTLWANGLTQHYRTWVMSFFVGSWTLLCLPYALCRGPGRGLSVGLAGALLFFLAMGLGRFAPVYPLVDAVLPGLRMFRYPEKWAVPALLPLIMLGAAGLERLLRDPPRVPVTALVGLLLGGATVVIAPHLHDAIAGTALFPAPALVDGAVTGIAGAGLHLAVVALVLGSGLAFLSRRGDAAPRAVPFVVAGLALVFGSEAARVNLPLMVTAPLEASTAPGPVVERMRAADPAARYRRVPDYARLAVHADATGYVQNQVRARVTGALHALVGEARQVHIHGPPIAQAEGALLTEALEGPHPLAGGALLGTRFYIAADHQPPAWLAAGVTNGRLLDRGAFPALRAALFEDRHALPRARRVTRAEMGPRTVDALRAHLAAGFDFATTAVLHTETRLRDGRLEPGADPVPLPDPAPGAPPPDPAATRFLRDDPEVVEIETAGAAAGLVVLSDAHAPGWRAFVDGAPTDILSADYVGRAVPVPAGRSVVRFEYTHPLLDRGLLISLTTAGLLVLGFGVGVGLRRRRRTARENGA